MYRRYQENPASIAPVWQEFFADYTPRAVTTPPPLAGSGPPGAPAPSPPAPLSQINVLDGEQPQPLRGPAKAVVTNMEASLEVPTATSVRSVPAKLLEINRQILNNHLARTRGGK